MAKKAETLKRWRELPEGQNPLPLMRPIPYKTEGSRYGCCGIRIDGTPEFIDAVLSNLKALLDGENIVTRLELARNPVKRSNGYKAGQNAEREAECCYIRLHQRGREGSMMLAYCKQHVAQTERYAEAMGVPVDD